MPDFWKWYFLRSLFIGYLSTKNLSAIVTADIFCEIKLKSIKTNLTVPNNQFPFPTAAPCFMVPSKGPSEKARHQKHLKGLNSSALSSNLKGGSSTLRGQLLKNPSLGLLQLKFHWCWFPKESPLSWSQVLGWLIWMEAVLQKLCLRH